MTAKNGYYCTWCAPNEDRCQIPACLPLLRAKAMTETPEQVRKLTEALENIALLDEADGHELTWEHASRAVAIAASVLGKHPATIHAERIAALSSRAPQAEGEGRFQRGYRLGVEAAAKIVGLIGFDPALKMEIIHKIHGAIGTEPASPDEPSRAPERKE